MANKYPDDLEILHTLGDTYLEYSLKIADESEDASRELFEEAKKVYAAVLQLMPDSSRAYQILGNAYAQRGLLEEAIVEYEKAVSLESNQAGLNLALGDLYFRKIEYDQAQPYLKKELEIDPHHPLAHLDLGVIEIANLNFGSSHLSLERSNPSRPSAE